MGPHIPLSYAMSECLGIIEFKVPSEVVQTHIDAVTLPSHSPSSGLRKPQRVTFKEPLESQPYKPSLPSSMRKPTKTVKFQEPQKTQGPTANLPSGTWPMTSSPNPSPAEETNPTTAVAWDIVALKWMFPWSFKTIGNMPRTYTIRIDPSIPLFQHSP